MSVLKMIIADDQHFVSGELHGSLAECVYAACTRHPKSLEELDALLPEFGSDEDLRSLFCWNDGIDLEPADAGLIIVDLAKKWVYAHDTYFGAHRRGSYYPHEYEDRTIAYEFSKEWQFVAEPKWFRYLESLELAPYANEETEYASVSGDEFEFDDAAESVTARYEEDDDDEFYGVKTTYMHRVDSLDDFDPQNAAEERDEQTLKHVARYERDAAAAQSRIEKAQEKITSVKIELQAVENLRQRATEPRWEIKHIALQAQVGKQEKYISHWTEEHAEAAAMAAELRNLLVTDKARQMLKLWEERDKEGWEDMELPF